jgi:hypothetical protein
LNIVQPFGFLGLFGQEVAQLSSFAAGLPPLYGQA